ncbi:xanthine dehydrogenase subunit D [Niallia sp. 03133]|uniref:xanthine dehydrogenase subunit D n=1 Tax=Niallia sp. 03133 TaxID=3458060 RepID=UPI004043EAFF
MVLNKASAGDKWKVRRDGKHKVTGELKFLTDMTFPEMLYGTILRSEYPFASILSIDTSEAELLPGVAAVLTYKDIPGLNGFGIIIQDQPVFCKDRVRFAGDAIAAIAAVSIEAAEKAASLIKVKYAPLTPITDPEESLLDTTVKLHDNGNLLHKATYQKGKTMEEAFSKCAFIVEETYYTPRQMHAYMETEGGVAVPEKSGAITLYAPTQHGFKDQLQLSRILDMEQEMIRVVSSPIGGSFGGKDELNIQPYISLLALKTGKPVKIHQSRRASIKAGIKRHPMKITMKTGVDLEGRLLAHKVRIIADTGAYATLGPAVLDFAVEHSAGPYIIENVEVEGYSVYTNNGIAGEFRGFGGNQITFALETQIERLAEKMQVSSTELRFKNIRSINDLGPVNQLIAPTDGAKEVLKKIIQSPILAKETKSTSTSPWTIGGTGYSITMHGGGLGYGRSDPSGARISLNKEGKIEVSFGFEECGQGLITSIDMIMTAAFNCTSDDIEVVIGDTVKVPHSGSSTASRATNMVWQGIRQLKGVWTEKVLELTSEIKQIAKEDLFIGAGGVWCKNKKEAEQKKVLSYQQLALLVDELPEVSVEYHFPTTPNSIDGGHFLYSFAGVAAAVEIDILTGNVHVTKMDHVVSAGPVVNPMGYLGQIEGGANMGLGFTLLEDAVMEEGRYMTENLDTYLIPTILDIPKETNVTALENLADGDEYGPRGVGEIGTVAIAPAIVAAIYDATGHWINKLPIDTEEVLNIVSNQLIRKA